MPKRMVPRQTIHHELLCACVAQGGGIYMRGGKLELQNSWLTHNKAVAHIICACTSMCVPCVVCSGYGACSVRVPDCAVCLFFVLLPVSGVMLVLAVLP